MLTLREEILVVVDYETLTHAQSVLIAVQKRRKLTGDKRHLTMSELSKMLFNMVEFDNVLEAWIKPLKKRGCVRIADMNAWRATKPMELYYRLTPAGWRRERDIENKLVKDEPVMKTKKDKGQS